MRLPFTSVVSYHTNTMTCGVAKFSAELAKRIGVPFVKLEGAPWGAFPLLSLKWSEIERDRCASAVALGFPSRSYDRGYGVFWHDVGEPVITSLAEHVFYADPSLGSPGLFCPSLIEPRKRPVRLFSFGMAHKLQTERYRRVREQLDAAGQSFHLRVSVGLHEGTSLDGAEQHFDALREIMGPENVTILGILSDAAVSEELDRADYVLSFFKQGLRANNTTVHAAIEHGVPVVTNHDDHTPLLLRALTRAVEGDWLRVRVRTEYSWEHLIAQMEQVCATSVSAIAR